jgi:hypothetical protein
MNKNKTHKIFLNKPFGSLAHFIFEMNLFHKSVITSIIIASHKTYANKFTNHTNVLAGITTLRITP